MSDARATVKGGTVTVDADEYLKLLDELADLEKRLRAMGSNGFNASRTTTRPPSSAKEEKADDTAAMKLNIDITGIEWKLSNRDGGGPAGPEAGWAWAFGYTKDGGILRENVVLIQALEQYGKVRVGQYEISLAGKDGTLLNRKKLKR